MSIIRNKISLIPILKNPININFIIRTLLFFFVIVNMSSAKTDKIAAEKYPRPIVAIVGSRTFKNYEYMKTSLVNHEIGTIVSGGCRSADLLAERFAKENNIPKIVLKPNWKNGRGAALTRNTDLILKSEYVIAFWDGKSPGTRDSITKARKSNKKVYIYDL